MEESLPVTVNCPACNATLSLGHTWVWKFMWSDGYTQGFYPKEGNDNLIVRCPTCGTAFIPERHQVGEPSDSFPEVNQLSYQELLDLRNDPNSINELAKQFSLTKKSRGALRKTNVNTLLQKAADSGHAVYEREIQEFKLQLMINLLHKVSHPEQKSKETIREHKKHLKAAALDLIEELPADEFSLLLKADCCRYLRRFQQCRELLAEVRDPEYHQHRRKIYLASLFRNSDPVIIAENASFHSRTWKLRWRLWLIKNSPW